MNPAFNIPIEKIVRRADVRPLDDEALAALAESIGIVGLINPIRVRQMGDRFEVTAGSHRLAACDSLGHHEILAMVVNDDDLVAELAMIDENLFRAELSPSDRARQTARRKAIYEELHPETVNGSNQHTRVGQVGQPFSEATAAATGQSQRAVRRDAERGEKVIDEVLDMVRGSRLDTGFYLDKIKNLPPNDQVAAARRDLAIERQSARGVKPTPAAPPPAKSPQEAQAERCQAEFGRLFDVAEEVGGFTAKDILAGCPPKQRAALNQRLSGLVELFSEIMEGASK